MTKRSQQPQSAEMIDELAAFMPAAALAICKQVAKESGASSGELTCPICRTGRLRWSIAPNGHGRAVCDRVIDNRPDGWPIRCVNVME